MKIVPMQVDLVDHMGSDLSVVNAARVSFSKISEEFNERDAKLIQYLARHNHWTPFGHAAATLRIKAPIFVARQFVKHQVGLVWNEVSRRYVDDEPEFWFPETYRGKPINAKQGS
jgi:thymidylate synthase (FAD)